MEEITRVAAVEVINRTRGKFISVKFIKKDGSERTVNTRVSVKKGVNGKGLKFKPAPRGLKPMFDIHKDAWIMVNLNTMYELSCEGVRYRVE